MQLTAIASAFFALAGSTPKLVSLPVLGIPEPLWLALWGIALIGFSSTLRARSGSASRPELKPASAGSLDTLQRSVARSA